jgi:hypothetical protein
MRAILLAAILLCGCIPTATPRKFRTPNEHQLLELQFNEDIKSIFPQTDIKEIDVTAYAFYGDNMKMGTVFGSVKSDYQKIRVNAAYRGVNGEMKLVRILCDLPEGKFFHKIYDKELYAEYTAYEDRLRERGEFKAN